MMLVLDFVPRMVRFVVYSDANAETDGDARCARCRSRWGKAVARRLDDGGRIET
jgi:hypothetical protein